MSESVRTVVAATDLSRPAFAAVRRAALVARLHGASLELLHVIPLALGAAMWASVRETLTAEQDLRSSINDNMEALAQQISAESGIAARVHVAEGKPFDEIARRADHVDADLVVIGSRGENVMRSHLLGTTAHRVLATVQKPVLLVKHTPGVSHLPDPGYGHMLIATDFSADAKAAARTARSFFPGAGITLFNAYQAPYETQLEGRLPAAALERSRQAAAEHAHAALEAFAAELNLAEAPRVARHGLPAVRIREHAARVDADLIVIGSSEMPRLQTMLLGSVSTQIVTEATCDVLLGRAAREPDA